MKSIKEKVAQFKENPRTRRAFHSLHGFTHLAYFGAVWVEGHGMYAMTGGALLIFGVFALVMGD